MWRITKINCVFALALFLGSGAIAQDATVQEGGRYISETDTLQFSDQVYGNVANYFANVQELLDFFAFETGQVVAEVGAYDGQNLAGFALLTDGMIYYAQDINADYLSQKSLDKVLQRNQKIKPERTNEFHWVIGTEKATNLPDKHFDKIIMISAFHEFTYMDAMITDIESKLKSNGQLIILETDCLTPGHRNYTLAETTALMAKYLFVLREVDATNHNGSTGMYKAIYQKQQ